MWLLVFLLAQVHLEASPGSFGALRIDARGYLLGDSVRVVALVSNQSDHAISACYKLGYSSLRERTRADSGEGLPPVEDPPRIRHSKARRLIISPPDTTLAARRAAVIAAAASPFWQDDGIDSSAPDSLCSQTEFLPSEVWADSVMVPIEDGWDITKVESIRITVKVALWVLVAGSWQSRGSLVARPITVTPLSPNSPLQPTPAGGE